MDSSLRSLERRWKTSGDPEVGLLYASALSRTGYLNRLWELTQEGDLEAAVEARMFRKLLGLPMTNPQKGCYVVKTWQDPEDPDNPDHADLYMAYLDGWEISNTPLSNTPTHSFDPDVRDMSPLEIQIGYNSNTWDTRWMIGIGKEHYQCPGCAPRSKNIKRWSSTRQNPDDLPASDGFSDLVFEGKVVISEKCPKCEAMFAYPTGSVLTCGDCYTEFVPRRQNPHKLVKGYPTKRVLKEDYEPFSFYTHGKRILRKNFYYDGDGWKIVGVMRPSWKRGGRRQGRPNSHKFLAQNQRTRENFRFSFEELVALRHRQNPDDPEEPKGVSKHKYFRKGAKTVCTSHVLAAFGIDACTYHYSGQLKQRCAILRKNGWAARSRNSHIIRGFKKLKMKGGTRSVGQVRRIIALINKGDPEINAWGDPLGTRYMIRVMGHALLLDYHGNTVVDTDPRIRDKRKVLDIRAVFVAPEKPESKRNPRNPDFY